MTLNLEPGLYIITGDDFDAIQSFVSDFLKQDPTPATADFSVDFIMQEIASLPGEASQRIRGEFQSLLETLRANTGHPLVFDIDRFPPKWITWFIRRCSGRFWPMYGDEEPLESLILLTTQNPHVLNQVVDPESVFVADLEGVRLLSEIHSTEWLAMSRFGSLYSAGEYGRSL